MSDAIAITRLVPQNSAHEVAVGQAAFAGGSRDGTVNAQQLEALSCDAPPPGLTGANVRAIRTSFANALAPGATAGMRANGCAPQAALPLSFGINESTGTAWKKLALIAHALPTLQVLDDSGKQVAEITRSYDSKGALDFFQNIFGATLTLREGSGRSDQASVLATAKPRLVDTKNIANNFRNIYDIYDATGTRIGAIQQTWQSVGGSLVQNMALGKSIFTTYEILDASDHVVARSDKIDFFNTEMKVSVGGMQAADLDLNWAKSIFRDKWHIVASPDAQVDRRVLSFMAAYKTMADIQVTQQNIAAVYGTILKIITDSNK